MQPDGTAFGSLEPIRDVIKNAGAYIAVLAAENPPEAYIKGLGPGYWTSGA